MRPPTSPVMRSANENTASMSCSIKRIVYCRFTLASSFDIARDSSMPKPAIGSSRISMVGWVERANTCTSGPGQPCGIYVAVAVARRAWGRVRVVDGGRGVCRGRVEGESGALGGVNGELNVSLGGEAVEDARDLERSRQPEPGAAGGRQLGDVAPVEDDPARIRPELAGQLSDQRG